VAERARETATRPPAQPWIPPGGLIAGQLAHGLSWALLLVLALRGEIGFSLPGLAWVHLVALAWVTVVALSILIHVIPAFCDVAWRWPRLARLSVGGVALGAYGLVAGFLFSSTATLAYSSSLLAVGLAVYLVNAVATLARARTSPRTERAIARALAIVLTMLAAATGIGLAMAWALSTGATGHIAVSWPVIHAHLGAIGWLTVLIMGVSMRTLGPIAGSKPQHALGHIVSGTAVSVGVIALVIAFGLESVWLEWTAAILCFVGFAVYLSDVFDSLARASVPHRPPQAFIGAAALWLAVAAVLGALTLAGKPYASVYVFVGLAGWIGQMVNAHTYHIGVRLLITIARDDEDDETRPDAVLTLPLTWLSFGLMQFAIALGAVGLVLAAPLLVALAAVAGLAGWIVVAANIAAAWIQARRQRLLPADSQSA
jgi:hypothetical protein